MVTKEEIKTSLQQLMTRFNQPFTVNEAIASVKQQYQGVSHINLKPMRVAKWLSGCGFSYDKQQRRWCPDAAKEETSRDRLFPRQGK